jgi:hypothetical protein
VIPPGYKLVNGGDGIAVFSVEGLAELACTREETGESLSLQAASKGPLSDYYALLPAGNYRAAMIAGDGGHARFYLVHFTVAPGVVSYVGTIAFRQAYSTTIAVIVEDDYDAAVARFRASRPELADEGVLKSLAEVQPCGSTGVHCDPGASE